MTGDHEKFYDDDDQEERISGSSNDSKQTHDGQAEDSIVQVDLPIFVDYGDSTFW